MPLVVGDFSGDRLNDLMLVSNYGLYAYVQVRLLSVHNHPSWLAVRCNLTATLLSVNGQ